MFPVLVVLLSLPVLAVGFPLPAIGYSNVRHRYEVDSRIAMCFCAVRMQAISFDASSNMLVSGGSDGTLRVWAPTATA